jgi:GR25 family glycosyltransferase involved in LPS biosynthesis
MIIDNILYINLDHRQDKRANIEQQIRSINKHRPAYRIPGVYPNPNEPLSFTKLKDLNSNPEIYRKTIACFKAHRNAINYIYYNCNIANPQHYSLILEDDIKIHKKSFIFSLLDSIDPPKSVDMIFLDNFLHKKYLLDNKEDSRIKYRHQLLVKTKHLNNYYAGAYAYLIKHNRLKKIVNILNNTININTHVDMFLFYNYRIQVRSLITNLIEVDWSFKSDRMSVK